MTRDLNDLSSDTKLNAQGVSLPPASNLQELFQQLLSSAASLARHYCFVVTVL
jgi:hypothetical protein